MKDFTILLEDKPGALAEVADTLGKAGINIEGGCGYQAIGRGIFHILVEDEIKARNALENAGIRVTEENEVFIIELENIPGSLAKITRKISDAGINNNLFYSISNNRIVLGVNDIEKVRAMFSDL